jgi:hypothetical protein
MTTRDQILFGAYPELYQGLSTDFNSSNYGQ